jgi:hemerythrin
METLRWDQSYSVNVAELDLQHQRLFHTVAELEHALSKGSSDAIINEILKKVVSHSIEHFATEEALMQEHGFPGLAAHCHEHNLLSQELTQFNLSNMAGRPGIPAALLDFLQTWLREHILKSDKQYSDFLNARGVLPKQAQVGQ